MTIILTVSSRDGIVMAADRKISTIEGHRIRDIGSRDKIVLFEEEGIVASYWGLATLQDRPMREHLMTVKTRMLEAEQPLNVDTFSEQLLQHLQRHTPQRNMGIHVAGYLENRPKIRHVFHVDWHTTNGFTNEESNVAFHNVEGRRVPHTGSEDYVPYISLFNGDNAIVQSMLLSIPAFRGLNYALDYETLSLKETVSLAELLVSTTIHLQKFLRGYRRVGRTCGNGLDIATITPSGVEWAGRSLGTVNFDVR
jgi:hypothetical protein